MKNNKRKSMLLIVRRVIQAALFVLLPGLFIELFSSIGRVVSSVAGGSFSFSKMSYPLFIIAAVIPVTVVMGRLFCSFMCAFGAMQDLIGFISRKAHIKRISINDKAEKALKCVKYIELLIIVILIWIAGTFTIPSDVNPWDVFGIYAAFWELPSVKYLLSIGGALLGVIIIASLFVERFFCRYLCPLGAVLAPVSRFRIFKINKPTEGCKTCRVCTNNCPMGLPLYKMDKVDTGECINCLKCVYVCPRHNISATAAKGDIAPLVTGALVASAITGLYYTAGYASGKLQQSAYQNQSATEQTSGYKDGVYEGTGQGYKGETSVKVTVEGGKITAIDVLSYKDDVQFFTRASDSLISQIINTQSTEVDAVSGATFSSNSIIEAVANALGEDFTNPNSTLQGGHGGGKRH